MSDERVKICRRGCLSQISSWLIEMSQSTITITVFDLLGCEYEKSSGSSFGYSGLINNG